MLKPRKTLALVLCLALIIGAVPMAGAAGVPGKPAYPDNNDLEEFYGIPDLMTFNDGSRVLTEADWRLRRLEVLDAVQYYEYGYVHIPEVYDVVRGGTADAPTISYKMRSWAPASATDPELIERTVQAGPYTITFNAADPAGSRDHMPIIIGAGNRPGQAAIAAWPAGAADTAYTGLYYDLYPSLRATAMSDYAVYDAPYGGLYDTGTLIANAWNIGRIIDALLLEPDLFPEIDPYGVTPYGFSRGGKVALLAAAIDERVAMGYSGHGGQGANTTLRFLHDSKKYPAGSNADITMYTAEQLQAYYGDPAGRAMTYTNSMFTARSGHRSETVYFNRNYEPWFSSRFQYFSGLNIGKYPIDHHYLMALLAPRPMIGSEGMLDFWNDPEGAALMYECARPVWELYGVADRLAFICSPVTAHSNAPIERKTADALFDYVYGDRYKTGGKSMKVTMEDLLWDADTNPTGIMRAKPDDMPWYAYVGTDAAGNGNATPANYTGYIPVGFGLSAFPVTDPTAITFAYPGQYTLHTNGTYNGKEYHTVNFIEGMKSIIPVTSTAPAVALYDPDGKLIQQVNTDKDGNALFTILPKQAKAGVYTFKTVGGNLVGNTRKIECLTWDFALDPEVSFGENNTIYWAWSSQIYREYRASGFPDPYMGREPSVENYVPAIGANVNVWFDNYDGSITPASDLRRDVNTAVNGNPLGLDLSWHKLEIQNYGVMFRTFTSYFSGTTTMRFNPLTNLTETVPVAKVKTVHIDGIQFPTLLPGYTFNYTFDVPEGAALADIFKG